MIPSVNTNHPFVQKTLNAAACEHQYEYVWPGYFLATSLRPVTKHTDDSILGLDMTYETALGCGALAPAR